MPLLAAMLLLPATRAVPPAVQDYRTARPCTCTHVSTGQVRGHSSVGQHRSG